MVLLENSPIYSGYNLGVAKVFDNGIVVSVDVKSPTNIYFQKVTYDFGKQTKKMLDITRPEICMGIEIPVNETLRFLAGAGLGREPVVSYRYGLDGGLEKIDLHYSENKKISAGVSFEAVGFLSSFGITADFNDYDNNIRLAFYPEVSWNFD